MANDPRLKSFREAIVRLEEALSLPVNPVVRDSCITRFELTFELSWASDPELPPGPRLGLPLAERLFSRSFFLRASDRGRRVAADSPRSEPERTYLQRRTSQPIVC